MLSVPKCDAITPPPVAMAAAAVAAAAAAAAAANAAGPYLSLRRVIGMCDRQHK